MMGKAADNERLRLRALFYNTLATACVITGLFVPYFVMLTAWGRMVEFFDALIGGDWARLEKGIVGLLPPPWLSCLAFYCDAKPIISPGPCKIKPFVGRIDSECWFGATAPHGSIDPAGWRTIFDNNLASIRKWPPKYTYV
jgi:hypothetical protein